MPDGQETQVKQPQVKQPPWWMRETPGIRQTVLPWWVKEQSKPLYESSDQGAFSKDWKGLTTLNPGYKDVLAIMTESGAQSPFWKTALKAQTGEGLSLEDNALIEKVWRILAEETAKFQKEAQEQKWYAKAGWSPNPTVRALEVSQFGKEPMRDRQGNTSEDRYTLGKQQAEGKAIEQRQKEQAQRVQELESKREALKGPKDWMKYIAETGETPSWLGYWMARNG